MKHTILFIGTIATANSLKKHFQSFCNGGQQVDSEIAEFTSIKQEDIDILRHLGYSAIDTFVHSNMNVGFGSGATTKFALERLEEHIKKGTLKNISIIPTSAQIAKQAVHHQIPIQSLDETLTIDLMIDSALEVDINLNISKDTNGNFLREKMVKDGVNQYLCLIHEDRLTECVGAHPISIEITPFAYEYTRSRIEQLPCLVSNPSRAVIRRGSYFQPIPDGDIPAISANGNMIVDLYTSNSIENLQELVYELNALSGVVEHSIINDGNVSVLIGSKDGVRWIRYENGTNLRSFKELTPAPHNATENTPVSIPLRNTTTTAISPSATVVPIAPKTQAYGVFQTKILARQPNKKANPLWWHDLTHKHRNDYISIENRQVK